MKISDRAIWMNIENSFENIKEDIVLIKKNLDIK